MFLRYVYGTPRSHLFPKLVPYFLVFWPFLEFLLKFLELSPYFQTSPADRHTTPRTLFR